MTTSSTTASPGVTESALDLTCFDGVVFGYDNHGRRTIKAPAGAELATRIRDAIQHRIQFVRVLPEGGPSLRTYGQCATCGDAFEKSRAGMCELCQCAREKWLEATGLLPPRGGK